MSFLTLRIKRIKIIDNRELFGSGEVKLLSFVTSEDDPLPVLDAYFNENDDKAKLGLLRAAASDILSAKTLMQVDHIKNGHEMIFGDSGYSLWTTRKKIDSFNWQMILVESDAGVREMGNVISSYINDPEFDTFLLNIAKLASFAVNPTVTLSIAIGKFVLGKVADELLRNKDDQIGVVYQSFYRALDFPAGDRQAMNIPDLSGNLRIDYRIYAEE